MGSSNSLSLPYLAARSVRVLVADRYPVILHGLRRMIQDDGRFEVVAEVSTMPDFWKAVAAEQPDVALLDWSMASQDPTTTTELLQPDFHPSVIFFRDTGEERDIQRLRARTVLSKGCSAEELLMAISAACGKAVPQDSRPRPATTSTFAGEENQDPAQRILQLTKREMQLLPLVCSGMKNKEIAMRLGIAESTVWHHLTSVFFKLGVEDRLGLATFAYRHKLMPASDEPLRFRTAQSV